MRARENVDRNETGRLFIARKSESRRDVTRIALGEIVDLRSTSPRRRVAIASLRQSRGRAPWNTPRVRNKGTRVKVALQRKCHNAPCSLRPPVRSQLERSRVERPGLDSTRILHVPLRAESRRILRSGSRHHRVYAWPISR